ncbi:hypothetical protein V1478_007062 [Vespula squamosa]|uniref:Uncharacterized protein n=1 Tax=Vespula squamosa TaxID=30214 RepID=A0ABD2B244_VESSQ
MSCKKYHVKRQIFSKILWEKLYQREEGLPILVAMIEVKLLALHRESRMYLFIIEWVTSYESPMNVSSVRTFEEETSRHVFKSDLSPDDKIFYEDYFYHVQLRSRIHDSALQIVKNESTRE